jgi:threonine dehydratase
VPTTITAADIDAAAARIASVIDATALQESARLSAETGLRVYLKREDLQAVRSYKLRGAYNLMAQLTESERVAGVVCASAGNHAQGVAFASRSLGIQARIYLPRTTPRQKRDRIRAHGGPRVELRLTGDTYDDAAAAAAADVAGTAAIMVAPFDDVRTMAGQGTIGAEILTQLGFIPDAVVVPVGGGGLLSGLAAYFGERAASLALVGVEPLGAASMAAALAAGAPVRLAVMDPFVDGAAVRRVGDAPFAVLENFAGLTMLTADEGAICTEMLALYQNEGIVAEPAGALSVAGLRSLNLPAGSSVVCLISGGNNDVSRYGEVLERSLVHSGLKHYFLVEFPQEPGALRRFLDDVLGEDDDITLFEYVKRNNRDTGPALVGIELGEPGGLPALLERMAASKITGQRLEPGSAAYSYLT